MSTAKKYTSRERSMSPESRRAAYGKINIMWSQMRPDLHGDKDALRDERLAWITSFLQLRRSLASLKDLSDGQIGLVLDEMQNMTGAKGEAKKPMPPREGNVVSMVGYIPKKAATTAPLLTETIFTTSDAQFSTLEKLVKFIGWTEEKTVEFLTKRKFAPSLKMQTFDRATALTMILLNIAADKDLRAQGKTKISRQMTAKHIPVLKRKLGIDQQKI